MADADSSQNPILYDISFESFLEAFEACVSNKHSSADCIRFYAKYQNEVLRIWEEVRRGIYTPGPSVRFVVKWPVYREIYAADFADRVVHHWWAIRVEPLYEERFKSQGDVSFNCRKGYGVYAAVNKVQAMMQKHPDWWYGQCDLEGYFMSMDKGLLWEMIEIFLRDNYKGNDIECLLYVTRVIVFHCPQDGCILKSPPQMFTHIPQRKMLSGQPPNKGCAIGNFPSQLNANFLGSVFDYYIIVVLKVEDYIRFVDDFYFQMPTRDEVCNIIPQAREYLSEQLLLKLHPKKMKVQPVSRGVLIVGCYIRKDRLYISNRTRGKFIEKIVHYNRIAERGQCEEHIEEFQQSINSYLGMMIHYNTYKVRRKCCMMIDGRWYKYMYISGHFEKVTIKKEYRKRQKLIAGIRNKEYQNWLTPLLFAKDTENS